FGQPKVTNAKGAKASKSLDLLRFIQGKDMVAVVPPLNWKSGDLGTYEHFGREVILGGPQPECLQEHYSKRFHPELWPDQANPESLQDHKMAGYQAKLAEQTGRQASVPN